ncbi:PIN domain-containing protein [Patescibacteria group bacterium]|nr:PIN domain-containing protein [Patescibacteria group bacterium]MBU4057303.1 PIN domain-containing protein [Patescibacteria group bacterium]
MLFIIDTYAWVEYFIGSKIGKRVKALFDDDKNTFITVECCLAELKGWSIRNNKHFHELLVIVETNSEVIPVSRKNWIEAAAIKSEMMKKIRDFGLIDAVLLAKQKELGCKIITADRHFKNLKAIEFLK